MCTRRSKTAGRQSRGCRRAAVAGVDWQWNDIRRDSRPHSSLLCGGRESSCYWVILKVGRQDCHSERSEESTLPWCEILRYAQDDDVIRLVAWRQLEY